MKNKSSTPKTVLKKTPKRAILQAEKVSANCVEKSEEKSKKNSVRKKSVAELSTKISPKKRSKNSPEISAKKCEQYDAQLFRRAILLQCEAAHPASISLLVLAAGMERAGFTFSDADLRSEVEYLSQKGYLEMSSSQISAAHKRARLSALGIDYLDSEGF